MTPTELGQQLKARRKKLKITQEKVAFLAGVSKPSVVAAEQGKPTLRLNVLIAVCTVLGFALELGPTSPIPPGERAGGDKN